MTCPNDRDIIACQLTPEEGLSKAEIMALRSPGRPKSLDKHEAILDAAAGLFAERGIDGVPIETIAAAANVSKVTVYANFKDKSAILEAIVQRETNRLNLEIDAIIASDAILGDRLRQVGDALIHMLTAPSHLVVDRCLGLESQRNPAIGKRFFDAGPGHMRDVLAAVLSQAVAQGEIQLDNPRDGAEDLLGLWLGFTAIERRFMCQKEKPINALSQRIDRTINLFLRANS